MGDILRPQHAHNLLPLLLLLAHLLVTGVSPTTAGAAPSAYQPNTDYYLKKVVPLPKQGLVKEEINKYRSYPHLDRAYRMQRENRLAEARKEFGAYLVLTPDDINARVSYLGLLNTMGHNKEVIAQADLIISRWSSFVPAYFYKGLALHKMGNPDDAFAVFSAAAAVQAITKEDRAFALTSAVDSAIAGQNYKNAGRALQTLIELEKSYSLYMKAGFIFEKSNQLKESLDYYIAAQNVATTPAEKSTAALAVAEIAKKAGNMEQVKRAYEMVIAHDNGNSIAVRGLAHLAYEGKKFDEAEKWAVLLVKKGAKPEDREFLAQLYMKRQKYDAAITELQAVVDQQGKRASTATLSALAQVYESTGRLQESAAVYDRLLKNGPIHGEMYLRYGTLLIRMKKFNEAAPLLEKALLLGLSDQHNDLILTNLALVYEKTGRNEKAAQELEKSVRTQTAPDANTLVRLALLQNKIGKADEALRSLDQALAGTSLSDALKLTAYKEKSVIFEKSGQLAYAVAELEKAHRIVSHGDPDTSIRLAVLLNKIGRSEEALRYLNLALAEPSLGAAHTLVAVREKGQILEKTGRRREAALEYEKAMALGDTSPGMLLAVANLYLPVENPEQSDRYAGYLQKVLTHPDATKSEKCSAEDGFGLLYFKQGRLQEATDHFSRAERLCGENWQRCYYRALAYFRLKLWQQALEQFLLAEKHQKDTATLVGIALCHKELNRSGAAVHYLQQALQAADTVTPEQTKLIYDTLGYLYAEEYSLDKAAAAFSRSLASAPDPIISMKLAGVYNRSEKSNEALKALKDVEYNKLSASAAIEYDDLKADLLQKTGHYEAALALMEKSQHLQATSARNYAMGILARKSGQRQKALDYFHAAYEMEPHQQEYALSLGYAYRADERYNDAIGIFEKVVAQKPDSPKLQEELGYLNVAIGNNEKAIQWFKKALDCFPRIPEGAAEERKQAEVDAYRIRSEITKLSQIFRAALFVSYRAGDAPSSLQANGEQIGGGLNGQIGVEASYRPPVIGLHNDRILELFGRVFGYLNPNSLKYNEGSTQAGIGLRYKFLQRENLWISGERLIGIGTYATDDWLLRLLYSRGKGFEPLPLVSNQDYYLIYGEVDGYLRSETIAASAEVRKGRAFTLLTDYLLTPYLVADGRWQSPVTVGGNYFEGGAGISLKYFFNNSRYENYRSVVDFSINYKHGVSFNQGFDKQGGNFDSSLVSLGIFF
jgi:tetratricopeptide (TPR) repeat protein